MVLVAVILSEVSVYVFMCLVSYVILCICSITYGSSNNLNVMFRSVLCVSQNKKAKE